MKTIRLLAVCVLAGLGLAANAQSYVPQKNSFSLGGGLFWGISEGKGDFQDVAGTPTCHFFGMDYRHYPIPNLGLGVTYNYLSGSKLDNELKCHYIAPTLTLRTLWANNKQAFGITVGAGYMDYHDRVMGYGEFDKGYFAASFSLHYEFAIAAGVGMQLHADFIGADWHFNPNYRTYHNHYDNYYGDDDLFDNGLTYFTLGVALTFGK